MPQLPIDVPDLSDVNSIYSEWMDRRDEEAGEGDFRTKIITIINGKGGVGKTSYAVTWATYLAAIGKKVLYVELDPQGNACEDLGIGGSELDDEGRSQVDSVLNVKPFQPTGEARPNLFVVPGGHEMSRLVTELHFLKRVSEYDRKVPWNYMYVAAVERSEEDYDVIVLDVAPGDETLQVNALHASDGIIVPTRSDPSSRKGLRLVGRRLNDVKQENDIVDLLGVVLFATNSSATKVQKQIRQQLAKDLGRAGDRILAHSIRYVESAAVQARQAGKTPIEMANDNSEHQGVASSSMADLARDYNAVNSTILMRVTELDREINNSPESEDNDG